MNELLITILANQAAIMKALYSDDFKDQLKVQIESTMIQLDKIQAK